MTQVLHLATAAELDRLEPMVAAHHGETGIDTTTDQRRAALTPLLEGSPHGAVWMIGPKMAPVGYIAVAFGWSIELGGLEGTIAEFWVREKIRGRGMGSEALAALLKTLEGAGVLGLDAPVESDRTEALWTRAGFHADPRRRYAWRA